MRTYTHVKIQKQVNTSTNSIPSSTESTGSFICILFLAYEILPRMKKKKEHLPKYEGKSEPQVKKKNLYYCPISPLPNPPPTTLTIFQSL